MATIKIKEGNEFVDISTIQGPIGPQGEQGPAGVGIPAGGGTGNIIVKNSTADYDTIWKAMVDVVYPVGSIYMNINSTNPGTLFGGTWEQIKDRFLLACGDSYSNGATGGESTTILNQNNLPVSLGTIRVHDENAQVQSTHIDGLEMSWTNKWRDSIDNLYNPLAQVPHNNMPPYLVVNIWKRIS